MADEYKNFLSKHESPSSPEDVKLYIKEIRQGSIITDLVAMAPCALPFMCYANTVADFGYHLKGIFNFLLGKNEKDDREKIEKRSYENISKFIEPVAKDNASQLIVNNIINGNVELVVNIDSDQANAAQNRIRKKLEQIKEPVRGLKEQVLLYWYQARNDPHSKAGDRAVIESIHGGPVKAIMDQKSKVAMLSDAENIFKKAYVVDVEVETIRDKPALYKILRVHDAIDSPLEYPKDLQIQSQPDIFNNQK